MNDVPVLVDVRGMVDRDAAKDGGVLLVSYEVLVQNKVRTTI